MLFFFVKDLKRFGFVFKNRKGVSIFSEIISSFAMFCIEIMYYFNYFYVKI